MSMADVNMKINKYMGIEFQQQGFALIEVLISVVVLALGILALLATQLRSVGSVSVWASSAISPIKPRPNLPRRSSPRT